MRNWSTILYQCIRRSHDPKDITLMILWRKEERSNRTVYLDELIWWCTICLLAGYELGANTLRICTAYGPTVCASCVKDDSIEIIKRSDYGVLKMVENNSVLRLNARFCFLTMSVSYDSYVSYLSYLSNGTVCVRWGFLLKGPISCPLRGTSEEPLLLLRRVGLI